jgi:hypothetical protein
MSFSPLLPVHISAGILGILSGATALSFRTPREPIVFSQLFGDAGDA